MRWAHRSWQTCHEVRRSGSIHRMERSDFAVGRSNLVTYTRPETCILSAWTVPAASHVGLRASDMNGPTAASLARRVLPVLLLCLMFWVQAAAASSPEHQRHHFADPGCVLCIAGPLQFVRSEPPALIAPVAVIDWIAPPARPEPTQSLLFSTRSSRAPPA